MKKGSRKRNLIERIRLSMFVIVALIIVSLNSIYYYHSKIVLKQEIQTHSNIVGEHIIDAMKSINKLNFYIDKYSTRDLRTTAIAVQDFLDSDINKVTEEQLQNAKDTLDIERISLIEQNGDDIKIVKSTEKSRVGFTFLKDKEPYETIDKFFKEKKVTTKLVGSTLENFWTYTITNKKDGEKENIKIGYYYDGSTNYMINLSITNEYQYAKPDEEVIEDVIFKSHSLKSKGFKILDISIIHPTALLEKQLDGMDYINKWQNEIDVRFNDKIIYGAYKYNNFDKDIKNIKEVTNGNINKMDNLIVNGTKVIKMYMPFTLKKSKYNPEQHQFVVIVTVDYMNYKHALSLMILDAFLLTAVSITVCFVLLGILFRIIEKKEREINDIQESHKKNIESLYQTVKSLRHDSRHHLFTIKGLLDLGKNKELNDYLENILNIERSIADIIDAHIPALSGLLYGKSMESLKNNIEFRHHFEKFEHLQMDTVKTSELIRVIGNIIDNAFYAVKETERKQKIVSIYGRFNPERGLLTIRIFNNGKPIPQEMISSLFNYGFTTKGEDGGKGIGLANCKKIIDNYKGSIEVESDYSGTIFIIVIPISQTEFI